MKMERRLKVKGYKFIVFISGIVDGILYKSWIEVDVEYGADGMTNAVKNPTVVKGKLNSII